MTFIGAESYLNISFTIISVDIRLKHSGSKMRFHAQDAFDALRQEMRTVQATS